VEGGDIMEKGGDTMEKKERRVYDVALEEMSTDGEKVIIDSPKLAQIIQAEKKDTDYARTNVSFRPVVPRPRVPLKHVSTDGKKVTIKSRALAAVVKAEKEAQTKNVSVVMVANDPTPEPSLR
jgi:hypothetical protein